MAYLDAVLSPGETSDEIRGVDLLASFGAPAQVACQIVPDDPVLIWYARMEATINGDDWHHVDGWNGPGDTLEPVRPDRPPIAGGKYRVTSDVQSETNVRVTLRGK